MSADASAMQQAQAKLSELLEAAKTGALIPIRLPGQIEEIVTLVNAAAEQHQQALREASANAAPADMATYMQQEAHFVGHAIHELRTPVTSIRGYGDMLGQMGELNDMQRQFLDVIKNNTRRLESLLWDVSYTNKLRNGTLQVSEKMDMFKNIAMRVENDMRPLAEQLKRTLELDIPQGLPLLNTDGDLLTVALDRLVENAIKYSPEGAGKVLLSGANDAGTLVITIADNGIGMTEDELAQLGTMYFRGDSEVVLEHKGSGLGVMVAYGILALLSATVTVASTHGEGTTFTIRMKGMT